MFIPHVRLSVDTNVHDALMKVYRCVVEIKMKVKFEDGRGSSKGVGGRGGQK